jgi:hypothetical protein
LPLAFDESVAKPPPKSLGGSDDYTNLITLCDKMRGVDRPKTLIRAGYKHA